jgi:phospholipid/cholesterol/gamma-HCH transport system permease protein
MQVTEQIDALEVMGVNPKQYLIAPRIIASIISTPLLVGLFDFVAMMGGYFLCIKVLGLDEAIFWHKTQFWLEPRHINEGLFKGAIFGFIFSTVCCFKGFFTKGGAKGVGDATNEGVVISMVSIIVIDYFATKFVIWFVRTF